MSVLVETSLGNLVVDLKTEECPVASRNFLKLCKAKFYNNCLFFNIQKDFVAQTGDPTGTGKGGTSFEALLAEAKQNNGVVPIMPSKSVSTFKDEIHSSVKHDRLGTVGFASVAPDSNASQFYITLRAKIEYLDKKKTIFGYVEEGQDVLQKINKAYCDEKGRPFQDVRIRHTHIIVDPFEEPPNLKWPSSPQRYRPEAETVDPRIADDEDVDDNDGRTQAEIEEDLRKESARANATALVLMGDLPHAEVRPEENILFVCKLNPVTTDEDLELIFSRFGEIKRCDIVKDFKTGDSLQYAFIEFGSRESCERAYFKMNNVLIDDRRIKVDFNQSTSKIWNKYNMQPWIQKLRDFEKKRAAAAGNGGQGVNANQVPLGVRKDQPLADSERSQQPRQPKRAQSPNPREGHSRARHSRSRSRDRKASDSSRDRSRRGQDRDQHRHRHHDRRRSSHRDRDRNQERGRHDRAKGRRRRSRSSS